MRRDVASTAFRIATPMAATARIKTLNHTSSWFEKTGGPDGAAIALAFMGWRWGCKEWRRAAEKTTGAGGRLTLRAVAAGRCVVRPLICRKTAEPGSKWKAHQAQARRSAASRERCSRHSRRHRRARPPARLLGAAGVSLDACKPTRQKRQKRLVVDSVVKQTRSKHRTGGGDAYSSHLSPFAWSMT